MDTRNATVVAVCLRILEVRRWPEADQGARSVLQFDPGSVVSALPSPAMPYLNMAQIFACLISALGDRQKTRQFEGMQARASIPIRCHSSDR